MPTQTYYIGLNGLYEENTTQSQTGFEGFGFTTTQGAPVYQCIANSLTETTNTSDQVVYGGEEDFATFTITEEELARGELWFRYYLTAGADGANLQVDDISIQVTYSSDVSTSQPPTDTFLTSNSLLGVAIGGGAAVAVGANSEILYSTDKGATWAYTSSPVESDFRDVIHDGKLFYACGSNGIIISSLDGVTWNVERNDSTSDYLDLTLARGVSVTAISLNATIVSKTLTSGGFNYIGRFE
jgi:hypothetical protein